MSELMPLGWNPRPCSRKGRGAAATAACGDVGVDAIAEEFEAKSAAMRAEIVEKRRLGSGCLEATQVVWVGEERHGRSRSAAGQGVSERVREHAPQVGAVSSRGFDFTSHLRYDSGFGVNHLLASVDEPAEGLLDDAAATNEELGDDLGVPLEACLLELAAHAGTEHIALRHAARFGLREEARRAQGVAVERQRPVPRAREPRPPPQHELLVVVVVVVVPAAVAHCRLLLLHNVAIQDLIDGVSAFVEGSEEEFGHDRHGSAKASLVYRPDASYNISFLSRGDATESSAAVKRNHGTPPFDSCAKMPLPFASSTATADVNPTIASRPLIRSGAGPLNTSTSENLVLTWSATLKNALSPYKLGGGGGGSNFDPKGKSESEVLFIQVELLSDKCSSLFLNKDANLQLVDSLFLKEKLFFLLILMVPVLTITLQIVRLRLNISRQVQCHPTYGVIVG
uniref:Uncharacterized protein n=1 Tax=Ananas comosus var. bracteatus TaxID=296719 RepID=A0A6V7QJT7_ANACO|nr:unnamed protein product [Ananas comosus var. bracteatus]